MDSIYQKLAAIQNALNAPKSQYNSFGKYHYRKCEDILNAAKPLAKDHGCVLIVSDESVSVGGQNIIRATATLFDAKGNSISASSDAGIEKTGGMQLPQAYGSASSYARKVALGGLFCLDGSQDYDSMNTHDQNQQSAPKAQAPTKKAVAASKDHKEEDLIKAGWDGKTVKKNGEHPYIETKKAYVYLTNDQYQAIKTRNKAA